MGLQSMYSGISGLQADSTWLDVISNNISNVNTVAYKASRVEFADQISQTLNGGSGDNPGSNLGGTDPEQVGLGTRVASIQTLFTQGGIQQTGNATDIAINGTGFLVSKTGDQTFLTRAGNLVFDGNGNLVDQNGGLIQGYTSSITYTTRTLDSNGGNPLLITQAALTLDDTDSSKIGNIQIKTGMVEPAKATTQINFSGNLDSFQQADQTGGILDVVTAGGPVLPVADANWVTYNPNKLALAADPNTGLPNEDFTQLENFAVPPVGNLTTPVVTGGGVLPDIVADGANYAWEQQPPVQPALTTTETVYDSVGNPRTVTFQFYQVNDLGEAGVNSANPGPSQAAYAWYAFDTTGGAAVSNATLVGGSGIVEGYMPIPDAGYDRGAGPGDQFCGDLVYFNTDGSLASPGAVDMTTGTQVQAHLYLPPLNVAALPADGNPLGPNGVSPIPTIGAEVTDITVNFGTAGILGQGRRDGLFSDAEGSYQTINGVNTYVPSSTAFVKSQDGFADGTLQSIQFDATGTIQGTFSNGQITALGQVVMASVDNPDGLNKVGSNYYTPSVNSGSTFIGLAGQRGLGTVTGDSLEGSNVDLTVELSNMIIAQRGFEVNARTIAVANSTLQTLTQLGQGG